MAPDVGLATNYNGEKEYNAVRSNPFKRSVTLNNSGNPARTGWLVHIKLDTKAIYTLNQCSFTFADLRVYDSDETTELQHWVEAPNTEWTSIFVRVDLPAGASKTIWLYYGNPGLEAKSDIDTLLIYGSSNIFSSWRLRYWGKANEPSRETGGDGFKDAFPAKYMRNSKGGPRFDLYQDDVTVLGGPYPTYYHNQVNGLPEIRFDGSNDYLRQGSYPDQAIIRNNRPYHIFAVTARADSGSNWFISGEGSGAVNQKLLFGWRNNTTLSLAQVGNDLDVTVSGYSSKTWQLIEGLHHNSYHGLAINGSIIGSNTNGTGLNDDRILRLGERDDNNDHFNGGIAELLLVEPPSTGLTSDDINNIRVYLRIKYALYDTSNDPTVTVNSQQASGSTEWDYTSYAPFADFRENIKSEVATYSESTGTVKITNLMQKTLAVGNSVEDWSLSSVDTTGQYISSHECRTRTATTSAGVDQVTIQRMDGSNNRGDLGKFEIENIVETTAYSSTDEDYIEFDLNPEDASLIDDTNSYIRFENLANTLSYQSALSNNENLLSDGILNTVRIKKSDFVKSGSGTWTDASYRCKINIQTSSGSQDVWYGAIRLVRRFDTAPEVDFNNPIRLRNGVSSDNDATYYLTTMQNGRITDRKIKNKEFELDTEDYLKIIQYKTFSDFDSFPKRFVLFDLLDEDGGVDYEERYYTFAMTKILGFIFPNSILDIDLDMKSGDDTGASSNLQFFWIMGNEQVEDKIETILKACGGMLWFEPETGKITARSGYKIWDTNSGLQPTAYEITNIVENGYKEADNSNSPIYNKIELPALLALRNRSNFTSGLVGIGTGGGLGTIRKNGDTTLFLSFRSLTRGSVYTLVTNNIRIGGWIFYTDDKQGFNNSGITIRNIALVADQVAITFSNSNGVDKELAAMTFRADILAYDYVNNISVAFDAANYEAEQFFATEANTSSIARRGEQLLDIDPVFGFVNLSSSSSTVEGIATLPDLYSELVNHLNTADLVQAEVAYDPYLHPGKYVSIRNKEGRLVYGYITALEHYSKNGEYRSVVTVREVGS